MHCKGRGKRFWWWRWWVCQWWRVSQLWWPTGTWRRSKGTTGCTTWPTQEEEDCFDPAWPFAQQSLSMINKSFSHTSSQVSCRLSWATWFQSVPRRSFSMLQRHEFAEWCKRSPSGLTLQRQSSSSWNGTRVRQPEPKWHCACKRWTGLRSGWIVKKSIKWIGLASGNSCFQVQRFYGSRAVIGEISSGDGTHRHKQTQHPYHQRCWLVFGSWNEGRSFLDFELLVAESY